MRFFTFPNPRFQDRNAEGEWFSPPQPGEHFEVTYTALHKLRDTVEAVTAVAADATATPPVEAVEAVTAVEGMNTIPGKHRHAITYLAVSKAASIAAFRAVKAIDPPSGAMYVTMRSKDRGFHDIAKTYYDMYIEEIGGTKPVAASVGVAVGLNHSAFFPFYAHR